MTDFLAGWKVNFVKTFRQNCNTNSAIRPSSDQAYCRAESKIKSRDFRSEENCENRSLPTDLGSSGWIASTEKSSGKQRTKTLGTSQPSKTVKLNTTPAPMDFGDVVQARAPLIEGDFGELIARAVAQALTPLDAQLKKLQTEIIAMISLEGVKGPDGMGDS